MNSSDVEIIKKVLMVEHQSIAKQIGFIDSVTESLDYNLLVNALGLLDRLSRQVDEHSKKTIITISAIIVSCLIMNFWLIYKFLKILEMNPILW